MAKPLILVTNDDGVYSPGLAAAAQAVENLGDVLIVAPHLQQTSMSRSFPRTPDTGIIKPVDLCIAGQPWKAFSVCGSPALTVSHAVLEIAQRQPDLCISGINYGENVGLGIIPSGTVGAALEANSYDIPAIAVSLEVSIGMQYSEDYSPLNWQAAMHFTRYFAEQVLRNGLPPEVATLNLNIPSDATVDTPVRLTRMSRQNYFVFTKPEKRDFNQSYRLNVEVKIDNASLEKDSDIQVLINDHHVSVTPLGWNLTVPYSSLEALSQYNHEIPVINN